MYFSNRFKHFISIFIICAVVLIPLYIGVTASVVEPPSKNEEKLEEISEEQKKILQSLFTLTQEITVLESEEKKLAKDIETAKLDIIKIEVEIAREQAVFEKNQEVLGRFFKLYQKLGPGSYLEIIMDSDNLSTFLRRLNMLRDLSRNAGKLLDMLEESKNKLTAEKSKLDEKLMFIEEKQKQSQEALNEKLKLKKEKEDYLLSLNEESKFYQEQLENMQRKLEELRQLLTEAAKEFSGIIEDGNLPEDAVKISISLFGVKGTLDEQVFNDITSKQTSLSAMKFEFHKDKVEVSMPDRQLELYGKFTIDENNQLSFQAEGGSFYGMPLELEYLEELMRDGVLKLNLNPLLGKNVLQTIKIQEGYIELFVKTNLF